MNSELNFDVAESRPVFTQTAGGTMLPLPQLQAVWNMTQDHLGCIASQEYKIIQHNAVVSSLFQAINNLNLKFSYDARQGNNTLFVDIKFPETRINVMKGEEFIGGLRIINSYNKTTGLMILPRLDRVVCSNGMVVSKFLDGYTIKHNQKIVEDFQRVIEKALNEMINASPKLRAIIEHCMEDSVEFQLAEKILYNLLKSERHTTAIYERLQKDRKDKLTRWDIYNAITDYVSHGEQLKPTVEQAMQMKAQKLLSTPTAQLQELELPRVMRETSSSMGVLR